jgi:kumamolisin
MTTHTPLASSKRARYPGARRIGRIDPNEIVELTVVLAANTDLAAAVLAEGSKPLSERDRRTHGALARQHGPVDEGLAAVKRFAREYKLRVRLDDPVRHVVHLRGRLADMERAFRTQLEIYERDGVRFRMRTGFLRIPAELAAHVVAVLGLDDRPQARSHARRSTSEGVFGFAPQRVANLYGFPPGDGSGETIALIELAGAFNLDELAWYFRGIDVPLPRIEAVHVDGARPEYGKSPKDDGEVMLDIEVAGAIAPGARIVVYFTPNTDRGFYDALAAAIYDTRRRPSIISICWGQAEKFYTRQFVHAFDELTMHAALLGITILVASGDDGASDLDPTQPGFDDERHVDFPAACPHVLACGGTSIRVANDRIRGERVWHNETGASGGGISTFFDLPAWQNGLSAAKEPLTHRGVPDVAANGDPDTGYACLSNAALTASAGTSAVAPLWAALIARINQRLKTRCGFITPLLYASAGERPIFRDIRLGNNGCHSVHGFLAKRGWDACTGLGSPNGEALLRLLGGPRYRAKRRRRAS